MYYVIVIINVASMSALAIHKTRKSKLFNGQARQLICSVREYFQKEKVNGRPLISMNNVLEYTAAACKAGKNLTVCIGKHNDDFLTDFDDTEPKFRNPKYKKKYRQKSYNCLLYTSRCV